MPISAIDGYTSEHWEHVRAIIREALLETAFEVKLVSDSDDVGVIQKRIVQNIYDNDIVICDVSAKNPNVMFELGMRLAFDKPAIIIKDYETQYSFDTAQVEHLEYPRSLHYSTIQAFKLKLKEKVMSTHEAAKSPGYTTFLKHFGTFVVANVDEKSVGKEDYIMQAIDDLRRDVRVLAKVMKQPEPQVLMQTNPGLLGSTQRMSALGFLTSKSIETGFSLSEIAKNKELCDTLFEEYYAKNNTATKGDKWTRAIMQMKFRDALSNATAE